MMVIRITPPPPAEAASIVMLSLTEFPDVVLEADSVVFTA